LRDTYENGTVPQDISSQLKENLIQKIEIYLEMLYQNDLQINREKSTTLDTYKDILTRLIQKKSDPQPGIPLLEENPETQQSIIQIINESYKLMSEIDEQDKDGKPLELVELGTTRLSEQELEEGLQLKKKK
jgi:hypothetical protein